MMHFRTHLWHYWILAVLIAVLFLLLCSRTNKLQCHWASFGWKAAKRCLTVTGWMRKMTADTSSGRSRAEILRVMLQLFQFQNLKLLIIFTILLTHQMPRQNHHLKLSGFWSGIHKLFFHFCPFSVVFKGWNHVDSWDFLLLENVPLQWCSIQVWYGDYEHNYFIRFCVCHHTYTVSYLNWCDSLC